MKICSKKDCIHGGKPQPKSNFHKHIKPPDGLRYECKDCVRKLGRSRSERKSINESGFFKMFIG